MGCDGCELWPTINQLASAIARRMSEESGSKEDKEQEQRKQIRELLERMDLPSDVYHARHGIAASAVAASLPLAVKRGERRLLEKLVVETIAAQFKCYAGMLHLWRGVNDTKPQKKVNSGYAPKFERMRRYPGRMREAVRWSDLGRTHNRPDKPWLDGLPRLIFISDMADLLSAGVDFAFIRDEVIENVRSETGKRHLWLWLTKRPGRMATFCDWLREEEGIEWPDNLVAMTSVTSRRTTGRADQLRRVKCRLRGLSVEPLWEKVTLNLEGIDWVIVGGESALRRSDTAAFDVQWAREIRGQCRQTGAAFFLKQLGGNPTEGGKPLALEDRHGGNWSEWPQEDLRIRELPVGFGREVAGTRL